MKLLKWIGFALGGLVVLIVIAYGVVYVVSERRIDREYEVAAEPIPEVGDSTSLAWGRHVAELRGCFACHGQDLGGEVFIDAAPIGKLYASNLTAGRGGVAANYPSASDWGRAIRNGLGHDSRPLLFMPSNDYWVMSDDDVAALVAHIRSVAPVDREFPESRPGPLGRALFLAGQFPLVPAEAIDHDASRPAAPPAGPTPEYGRYLATICQGCHRADFAGGAMQGVVVKNITPDSATGIGTWSEQDFLTAMRTGTRPDGTTIDPELMPWEMTKTWTDDEIRAVYRYLRSLPPKPQAGV